MESQESPERTPQETDVAPHAASDATPAVEAPSFVYALGQIDFRFPNLGLEKEFAQVIGRGGEEAVSDRSALQTAIAQDQNRYLARGLCWVLLIEGLEAYILVPRDPADYRLLIEAVREYPRRDDVDLVIGTIGPIAPPEMCNGLAVRLVFFDQIYSFDRDSLVEMIPTPDTITDADKPAFHTTAAGFFDRVMQMADNAGATDEHRALNYMAVRYPRIYATLAEEQGRNTSLSAIEARRSSVSGVRRIVDVILSFTHRQTDVTTKHFARIDVNDLHPFLMTPLSPYYDVQ